MGILGNLFKKNPQQAVDLKQEKIELSPEAIVNWLLETNKQRIISVSKELSEVWSEMINQIYSLQSAISLLEKAKFEPNDRMYAPINMIKDRFINKSKLLNKVPRSIPESFSDIKSTHLETSKLISEIKEADIKQAHVISVYFKKETENIIKALKNIDKALGDFDKKLKSDGDILEMVEFVNKKAVSIKQMERDVENKETEMIDAKKQIEKAKNELEKQKAELGKIEGDSRWSEIKKIGDEIDKIEDQMAKISYSVKEDISSVKRPIKKILHDAQSQIKTELPEDIENLDMIYSTFNMVDNVLSKSKIDLKGTELEKLNHVRNKIKSGEFEESKKKFHSLGLKRKDLGVNRAKIGNIEALKKQKEQEIKNTEVLLEKLVSEEDTLKKEELKSKEEIGKLKEEIKKIVLEKLNVQLKII